MGEDLADYVDRIYEAAVLPELWPSVLADLNTIGRGDGALLFTFNESNGNVRYTTSPGFEDTMASYVEQRWPERTDRLLRLFAKRHSGFLTDHDVYSAEEIEAEPVYREFLRPSGLGWGAASAIHVPTGDRLIFDVERAHARGPVPADAVAALDRLRPHLARAATMSARLRLETVRASAQTLDLVGLPAIVLGQRGNVLAMSDKCAELPAGLIRDSRSLALSVPGADLLLKQALGTLSSELVPAIRSIPIPGLHGSAPMVLHVLPVRRQAADLFAAAAAIVVFTPVALKAVPGLSVIEGLFDLTAAEARVARAIAMCQTVEQTAEQFGVSRGTVRSQLKTVMLKTGLSRQSDLIGMLAGTGMPP